MTLEELGDQEPGERHELLSRYPAENYRRHYCEECGEEFKAGRTYCERCKYGLSAAVLP